MNRRVLLNRTGGIIHMIFPTHIVAASGIVVNDKNEVLLVKNHRGEWTWTGGQVEIGENLIDAVKREIF
jgi:8-oxo-dGTP diphosphatase